MKPTADSIGGVLAGWLACVASSAWACECVEPEVVSVDERNRRYLVAIAETSEVMIRASVYDLVKQAEAQYPAWAGNVSISFFSSREWASRAAVSDSPERHSEWAANYLAEYSQSRAELTMRPHLPGERRTVALMVVLAPPE